MKLENETLQKIQQILDRKNWSLYRLAKESDIAYSSLNNLFQRNTEPTLPTLRKICRGLGISLSDFFSDCKDLPILEYTDEEGNLINLYRSLNPSDQKILMAYAYGLNHKIPE